MRKVRISTKMENIRRYQTEITSHEHNNWTKNFNGDSQHQTRASRRNNQQTWIRGSKIIPSEEQNWKKEYRLRDLWDIIKQIIICILGVPEIEDR